MKTLKYSRQREAIIDFLKVRKDHPTADLIYSTIKTEYPNISLGTVYRNLTLLSETGIIQKLSCGTSSDHFDYDTSPHPHFICTQCNAVIDLEMNDLSFLDTLAENSFDGKVDSHQLFFYGKCGHCTHDNF